MCNIKQGDIYWAELPVDGMGTNVQKGKRPYLVVSNDAANSSSTNVTVVPLTSATKKYIPTHVVVRTNGRRSIVECEQPMTVDKKFLGNLFGILTQEEFGKVMEAIKIQFQAKGGRYEKHNY